MINSPRVLRPATRRLLPVSLLLSLAACGGGSGGGGGPAAPGLAGSLSVFEPDPTILEAEPNDTLAQAHQLGDILPGGETAVVGSITQSGSDQLDVFEFQAPQRVTVDVTLTGITQTADLDLLIIDPVSLQIVRQAITPNASEMTTFVAKGTFFVVVDAFQADSDYELTLAGRPSPTFQEIEANDTLLTANYLGTLALGEQLTVEADGADPGSDFYVFSIPAGQTLSFRLTASDPDGDYEIDLSDVTQGLNMPVFLERFETGPPVESGQRAVNPMSLYALEVFPFEPNDVSSYTLEIANGILSFQGAATQAAPARRQIGRRTTAARAAVPAKDPTQLAGIFDLPAPVCRGDVIVQYAEEPTARSKGTVDALAKPMAVDATRHLHKVRCEVGAELTDEEVGRTALAVAATLRGMPDVAYAELDHLVEITALPQTEVFPDDTFYNLQWHYEQIGLPRAWGITTGSSAVRVAVLDTGTVAATDLMNAPGIDMISDPAIAGDGDGVDNDPTDVGDGVGPQPSSYHGAHVAGTVAARTDNGFGVSGVSWNASVFHVRVLGIGGGSSFDIAEGIRYAAGLSNSSGQMASPPADIINMSLGGPGFNQTVQNACSAAHSAGSVVIAAAGNNNSDVPFFPAAYDDVISVSAVDFERRKAPYSNFHPTVDIAAPGGDVSVDRNNDNRPDGVLSTKPDDSVSPINLDGFSFYQGTSMAAPHVAGVAALMLTVDSTLTPDEVEMLLRTTATDLGAPGRDSIFGEGLVNAFAAVQAANGGGGVANPILSLDSGSILFDSPVESLRIGVSNAGGGSLEVTSVVATTSGPQGWLSATSVPTGQSGGASDTSAIDISVSAGGLADGLYTGTVTVNSNGGSQALAVTLALGQGQTGPGQNFEVFVIAVNADTLETEAQDVVMTGGSLVYSLDGLEPGRYLLVAGTDEDGDDLICDPGEPLCGFYPALGLSTIVELEEGERITGLNFPLQPVEGSTASAGGVTFRLLERSAAGVNQ